MHVVTFRYCVIDFTENRILEHPSGKLRKWWLSRLKDLSFAVTLDCRCRTSVSRLVCLGGGSDDSGALFTEFLKSGSATSRPKWWPNKGHGEEGGNSRSRLPDLSRSEREHNKLVLLRRRDARALVLVSPTLSFFADVYLFQDVVPLFLLSLFLSCSV